MTRQHFKLQVPVDASLGLPREAGGYSIYDMDVCDPFVASPTSTKGYNYFTRVIKIDQTRRQCAIAIAFCPMSHHAYTT